MKDAESKIKASTDRMKRSMTLSLKLGGAGVVATGLKMVTTNMVRDLTQSYREIQRASGDLRSLGMDNVQAVIAEGQRLQNTYVGLTADAFTRAAYDIKSGVSSLTDEGVAAMTASALTVAKATKGMPESMTSLFATSYGIFKKQFSEMSDADWGDMFGAALSASVQRFKTDGAKMQAAIESAGAGATNFGMKMTEQMTLLGMMQQQMAAGEAGTALKAFAANAARAHDAFAKMEITDKRPVRVRVIDENGMLREMPDILADLKARYGETLDTIEAAEIAKAFGTEEAMKMINALYGQEEAVRANADALQDAARQGAAFTESMAANVDDYDGAKWKLFIQQLDVMKQKIGAGLLPAMDALVPLLGGAARAVGDFAAKHPGLVAGLGAAIVGVAGLATVAAPLLFAASSLVTAFAALRTGALMAGIVLRGVGTALMANPIGLAVAVIAGGAYLIWKNWEPISAFFQDLWGQITDAFNAGTEWVSNAVSNVIGFDWSSLLTLEGLTNAWAGITGFLGGVIGTLWDALSPLSWLGIVKSDDLAGVWAGITTFVSDTAGKLWDGITGIEWGSYIPTFTWETALTVLDWASWLSPIRWLELIPGFEWSNVINGILNWADWLSPISWDGFVGVFTWENVLTALDWATWLSPVRWLEVIPGFKWSNVIEGALDWADWLNPFSWGQWVSEKLSLGEWVEGFEWSDIIAVLDITNWLNFSWSDVLPDWDWGAIIPDLPDIKGMFSDAGESIDVRLENRTQNTFGREWEQGIELVEQYRAGLISLSEVKAKLEGRAISDGVVFDSFEVNRAQDMLNLLNEIEATTPTVPEIQSPETLVEAARVAQELTLQYPALTAAAQETQTAVTASITQMGADLSATDFASEGQRIMQSLANGIRSQIATVTAAARAITAAIRSALPRSATMRVSVTGGGAPIQARARGGNYGPGWLLTGEEGPELRYANESGFIAHNGALRGMVEMAERARGLARGIASEGALKGGVASVGIGAMSSMATAAPVGGMEAFSQLAGQMGAGKAVTVHQNPTYHIDLGGAGDDMEQRLRAVLDEHTREMRLEQERYLND